MKTRSQIYDINLGLDINTNILNIKCISVS